MKESYEIKLQLLKEFEHMDDPVGFCREAYKFLTEGEEVEPRVLHTLESEAIDDGIYLVYEDGHSVKYESGMKKSHAKGVTGIGVVYDGHPFQVALEDLGEQPLIKEENNTCPEESPFYKTECEGLHDWDFVSATNHLKECGMDMPLPDGWYIPTLAVLEVMCFLKKQINEALEFAGGKAMPDDYHWSSTEYNRYGARYVNFGNGLANTYNKYYGYVVRAVTAFSIAR